MAAQSRRGSVSIIFTKTLDSHDTIKIGTCAWSFDDWRGGFYPGHLPVGERLDYYARHFRTVEADSTFYHAPPPAVTRHWMDATPVDFSFCCKAPRELTHARRLRDSSAMLDEFLSSLDPLGEKLACVFLQLPPSFRPRSDEAALRAFVRALPAAPRFAIEFRSHEWHVPRIVHLLEEHRVCWVWTDTTPLDHQQEGAFEFLPQTADFSYVRLLGDLTTKYAPDGSTQHEYRELRWPRDVSLENWAVRLRQRAADGARVFVQVSNHFEGCAPHTCRRLAELLGQHVPAFGSEEAAAQEDTAQLRLL